MFPYLARWEFWKPKCDFIQTHSESFLVPFCYYKKLSNCITGLYFAIKNSLLLVCQFKKKQNKESPHGTIVIKRYSGLHPFCFHACCRLSLITALHTKTQMQSSVSPGAQSLPFDWRAVEKTSWSRLDVPLVATDTGADNWKVRREKKKKKKKNGAEGAGNKPCGGEV